MNRPKRALRSICILLVILFLLNLFLVKFNRHASGFDQNILENGPTGSNVDLSESGENQGDNQIQNNEKQQNSDILETKSENTVIESKDLTDSAEEIIVDITNVRHSIQLLREYKACWDKISSYDYHENYFNSDSVPSYLDKCKKKIKKLEESPLLNWNAQGSMHDLFTKFKGRGVVIPVYQGSFEIALAAIYAIRNIHRSTLPIEFVHNGPNELTDKQMNFLKNVENSKLLDLQHVFPQSKVKFAGWSVKAASLLAASCSECILMDSDVIFLKSPDIIFEQSKYKKHKALLFKDRTYPINDQGLWVKDIIPQKSLHKVEQQRLLSGKTYHEAEAGVFVIDKSHNFVGMLAIVYMNIEHVTPFSYHGFHGDKETFWIGLEALEESYSFDVHLPFAIGNYLAERDGDRLCSVQIGHQEENGDLFWLNGGILEDKLDVTSEFVNFSHWIPESGEYEFATKRNSVCSKFKDTSAILLGKEHLDFFDKLREYWNGIDWQAFK